ncbi:hypothetical protein [Leifsonia virtsii]|uniref:Uncharacterized protein n=1 Tax=Leifsonia virtsii TaxID=3035915 RepID=A0ABT8ITX6_9MICO|nr:hypothetical protein [Leifsonia virtsii]MDN4595906.1 hypothetical protein [Leifsonia virtsii]
MSLDALDAQIDGLRADAKQIQAAAGRRAAEINNDTTLSDEGKRQAHEQRLAIAQERAKALRDKEIALVKDHIKSLETKLDAKVGYGTADLIAFRDAQERSERIEGAEQASRTMGLALRSNDRTLAHALFRRALEAGWTDAVRQFEQEYPESATAAREIEKLQHFLHEAGLARAVSYMVM